MIYPNLFKAHYSILKGRDWIRRINPDDRKVFVDLGLRHADHGKLGGQKRATTAKRDEKGRFVKNETL